MKVRELIGKPVVIRGIESRGMLLAVRLEDSVRVVFADEDLPEGAVLS